MDDLNNFDNSQTNDDESNKTDNLDSNDNNEPDISDNSNSEENKPENDSDENNGNSDLIGGKFKTQEDLLNAYNEIEKQRGETSKELGELRKVKEKYEEIQQKQEQIAKSWGFNSVQEMEQHQQQKQVDKEMAATLADEYLNYIGECQFPDEMKSLLLQYRTEPNEELLKTIEEEFPKSAIREVAKKMATYEGQLAAQKRQAQIDEEMRVADQYLADVTTKYGDERYFKNNEFKKVFAELFMTLGPKMDTEKVINTLENYVQSRIELDKKAVNSQKENANSTDKIDGLNSGQNLNTSSKSILDMNEDEIRLALRTTYKNV